MAKKSFIGGAGGIDTIISDMKSIKAKEPTRVEIQIKSNKEGTLSGESRATYILQDVIIERIKEIAYIERKKIKEVVSEAFEAYIKNYDKHNKQK